MFQTSTTHTAVNYYYRMIIHVLTTLSLISVCAGGTSVARPGARSEVSFEVIETPGITYRVGAGAAFRLHTVTRNEGGGYNPNSGVFVAPVGGTYQFWANVMNGHATHYLTIELWKENALIIRGHTPRNSKHETASIFTLVNVKKGDHVWLKALADAYVHGWYQSSFGGLLIRPH